MAEQCAQCGSERVVPQAMVRDATGGALVAYVYAKPEAFILKRAASATLSARICADCGHAALFAEEAKELYEAWQRSQAEGG